LCCASTRAQATADMSLLLAAALMTMFLTSNRCGLARRALCTCFGGSGSGEPLLDHGELGDIHDHIVLLGMAESVGMPPILSTLIWPFHRVLGWISIGWSRKSRARDEPLIYGDASSERRRRQSSRSAELPA